MKNEKRKKTCGRFLTVLLLALTVTFMVLFVIFLQGYRNIPELESLKDVDASWFELDFNLAFYGKLPKGDYRIVVNGEDGSVVAEYKNVM